MAGAAEAGIFTRTEITAGFTLVTRSAKPAGCCVVESAALALDVSKACDQLVFGPASNKAAPTPATEANSVMRRADSAKPFLLGGLPSSHFHLLDQWVPMGFKGRERPAVAERNVGKSSYSDLERD